MSPLGYIDEDNDLKFINTNDNPFNSTEHTVYVVSRCRPGAVQWS